MELTGEVLMDAPRERVWDALNDAAVLQSCIPGCEEVHDDSPTERRVRVMVKVGPVRARFTGKVTLSQVQVPERCTMAFEGSGGAAGMASGRSQVTLHEDGAQTRLAYTVNASVGGKLGQIGGRMIDASAKQLADQFFDNLRARLAPAVVASPSQAPTGNDAAPAPVHAAAGTAATPPHAVPAPVAAAAGAEASRVLWFLLGVASTGLGVWIGARLF